MGILLFCKELIYTVCLRLTLVGYVSIISLIIFPFCAGWLLNLLVFTIPLSYLIYAAPAFVLAIALSAFMIIFNRLVLNKKRSFIFFSILIAPCIVLSNINFYEFSTKQPWVLHFIEIFFSSRVDETTISSGVSLLCDGIILLAIVLMIAAVKSYTYVQGRDDQALSIVTSNLDTILANDIYVEDMEDHETEDFNRANASQRLENAQAARQLHKNIMQALQQGVMSPSTSLAYLTASFGNRIPTDTSLVRNDYQNPEDSIPNILQTPSIRRDSSVKLKSQSSG